MTALLYPFMLLAALGLTLSAASHVASIVGLTMPGGGAVWSLHIGVFVVWVPTVLVASRMSRHAERADYWRVVLAGCPAWARYALMGLFGYALLNFVLGMVHMPVRQGADESASSSGNVRLFSGHWMLFYAAAFATLYSAIHDTGLLKGRKCIRGHDVAPADKFCAECGAAVNPEQAAR